MDYLYHIVYVYLDRNGVRCIGDACYANCKGIKTVDDYLDLYETVKNDLKSRKPLDMDESIVIMDIQLLYDPNSDRRTQCKKK